MKLNKLKKIIKLVEESNIEELEIKGLFRRVRITKKLAASPSVNVIPSQGSLQRETLVEEKKSVEKPEEKFFSIKAPMVGTFYSSPSPGAPPYVEIGDKVTPDKVVCVIEAMKVMNEIEAGISGIIKKVLPKNEEPVEYGQKLFLIEPA
ncbi:acetyl-CoA carboxylase biotin carboxyl carrier protein [candidate division WOR-3 bacterium]|nr:acetyl-CoA carboxylase biotin carboxyl carrier protein [candidate division WOR-3 bacterium]